MKTYIQIGANVGNDDFYRKMCGLSESSIIVLVEPNHTLIAKLYSCYNYLATKHKVIVHNNGIVYDVSIDTLFLFANFYGNADELSSVIARKSFPHIVGEMKFAPMTFEQLCSVNNITEIEELHIDTEGYDYTILNSIDFSIKQIKFVTCEIWTYDVDSTANIKTGSIFFNEVIRPKMDKFYDISETVTDGMPTHVFTRRSCECD